MQVEEDTVPDETGQPPAGPTLCPPIQTWADVSEVEKAEPVTDTELPARPLLSERVIEGVTGKAL